MKEVALEVGFEGRVRFDSGAGHPLTSKTLERWMEERQLGQVKEDAGYLGLGLGSGENIPEAAKESMVGWNKTDGRMGGSPVLIGSCRGL